MCIDLYTHNECMIAQSNGPYISAWFNFPHVFIKCAKCSLTRLIALWDPHWRGGVICVSVIIVNTIVASYW